MSIMSAPGAGTRVILEAPVPQSQPEPAAARSAQDSIAVRPVQRRSTRSKSRIRVLLVDDHKILREGLSALLKNQPDLEVVGEASDGYAALSLIRALQPDVILMDINMPGLNGIEATRIINADYPNVRVIGLSMHGANSASAMRDAGAVDFIHKGARADEVLAAIRAHAPAQKRRKPGRAAAL
jgi:CheY-like chemotaxis protein